MTQEEEYTDMPEIGIHNIIETRPVLNLEKLREILLDENVENTPTIIISVIGDTRTAKGILMNGIYAFLKAKDNDNPRYTLSNADMYLHVRGDAHHEPGIRICDGPIFRTIGGKKVAIILMIAQVSIIEEETPNTTKDVLAFASFISSINILNFKQHIKQGELMCIKKVLEHKELLDANDSHLLIAVRKAGNQVPEQGPDFRAILETTETDSKRVKETKEWLQRNGVVNCYTFPHSNSKRDPEKRPDLNPNFLKIITKFVKQETSDEKLAAKRQLTGKEIYRYAEEFNRVINDNNDEAELSQFKHAVQETGKMIRCEKAYEDLIREATPDIIGDKNRLDELRSKAEDELKAEARDNGIESSFRVRAEEKARKLFEDFEKAGKEIEGIKKRLRLKRKLPNVAGNIHLPIIHPDGESSEIGSGKGESGRNSPTEQIPEERIGYEDEPSSMKAANPPRQKKTE